EVRSTAFHEQRRYQQTKGRRQQPEAEVVHPRQRHVRRADHQWNHPVGQADEGWHHRTEDHDQTVHGGHLVEEFRLHDLQAGLEQLGANDHREGAAQQERAKAEPQVHRTDVLVVGGQHPAHQALGGAMVVVAMSVAGVARIDHCTHLELSYSWACLKVNTSLGVTMSPTLLPQALRDRKSTRLNSSHVKISYAVFCLKKKMSRGEML